MPNTKSQKTNKRKNKEISKEIKQTKELRYPRPLGLTYALHQYHNLQEPQQKQEELNKIKNLLINQWIANGMMLNNKLIPIADMSTYLNIPTQTLMLRAANQSMKIAKILNEDKARDWARAQFFSAQNLAIENHALARSQALMLLAQQGENYVPFLTSEVNKSLANLTAAQKPILDILKAFMEKNSAPLIQLEVNTNKQSNTFVTPDEAVRQIRNESPSLIDNTTAIEAKMEALPGLPNINARTQDLATIGLRNPNIGTENGNLGHEKKALENDANLAVFGHTKADGHRKRASDLGTFDGEDLEDFIA